MLLLCSFRISNPFWNRSRKSLALRPNVVHGKCQKITIFRKFDFYHGAKHSPSALAWSPLKGPNSQDRPLFSESMISDFGSNFGWSKIHILENRSKLFCARLCSFRICNPFWNRSKKSLACRPKVVTGKCQKITIFRNIFKMSFFVIICVVSINMEVIPDAETRRMT